jgi:hypothetical protein
MITQGQRLALIVASSQFTDQKLQQLIAPSQDAAALAGVLKDPTIGDFEVKLLINYPSHDVCVEIEDFFADGKRDDLLLLYFSSHGIKDDDGRLYLATIDTECRRLRSKTVPASFVNDNMSASRSRRQVLILDCCYSGAFARGMVAKGGSSVDVRDQFKGRGRVVLTASSATQYAFQGDEIIGEGCCSVFTHYLVRGLETGEADLNGDSFVSLDELYDYVYERVTDETPQQTPGRWNFDLQGNIFIARNPLGNPSRVRKEALLTSLLRNPPAMLYLHEAEFAGLDVEQLLHHNLGAMLERIVRQIAEQNSQRLACERGETLSTDEICRLLSYLGWYMLNEGITSCDVERAASVVEEVLAEMDQAQYDVAQALDWLATTYWLRKTDQGTFEFRDSYVINVFAAMELKERFSKVYDSAALALGPSSAPVRWEKVLVLLAGMLPQDQATKLIKVFLDAGWVQLAGWCISEGQPVPQSVVARVINALLELPTEERMQ